ncbi:fluoride efflux transporter CrcB [soil metagenome]
MIWFAVGVAGAAGAACRYVVDFLVTARTAGSYPVGTLVVNVSGSLLVGVVAGVVANRGAPGALTTVAGVGFAGSYTTFSTLVYESWRLIEDGAYLRAATNMATILLGMAAAAAGWALTAL